MNADHLARASSLRYSWTRPCKLCIYTRWDVFEWNNNYRVGSSFGFEKY